MNEPIQNEGRHALDRLRASLPEGQLNIVSVMERVRGEYLPGTFDDDLRRGFDALLRTVVTRHAGHVRPGDGDRRETRAMVLVGESGAGKTECLLHLFRNHPSTPGYGVVGSGCPLVTVSVPTPCTLKVLGYCLLRALGYPVERDLREHQVWTMVYDHLPLAGALLVHLDEMHNLTDGANVEEIKKIRKTLKSLMVSPAWPVGIIVSGIPSIVPDMRVVEEIRRRGRFLSVPLVEAEAGGGFDNVGKVIVTLAKIAGIVVDETLAKAVAPRLAHAALYRFGIVVELIHEAIEVSLADGIRFDQEAFATAYFDRTGVGDRLNPFVEPVWHEIDCTLVLLDEAPPVPVLPEDPAPRKGKGGKSGKGVKTGVGGR